MSILSRQFFSHWPQMVTLAFFPLDTPKEPMPCQDASGLAKRTHHPLSAQMRRAPRTSPPEAEVETAGQRLPRHGTRPRRPRRESSHSRYPPVSRTRRSRYRPNPESSAARGPEHPPNAGGAAGCDPRLLHRGVTRPRPDGARQGRRARRPERPPGGGRRPLARPRRVRAGCPGERRHTRNRGLGASRGCSTDTREQLWGPGTREGPGVQRSCWSPGPSPRVAGQGFEPWKAKPTDLQSAPIGRSGNLPGLRRRVRRGASPRIADDPPEPEIGCPGAPRPGASGVRPARG